MDDDAEEDPPPFVDLYAALELDKSATSAAIKKAYRTLALRWHPDKNIGDDEAQIKFQDISKAYGVLSDPKKKAYYDTTGDVEDIDVSAEDFVKTFVAMMDEMLGPGGRIEDVLEGVSDDADFEAMPPFPFPKHLFPKDTFPSNMRFSEEFHVPPAVTELIEREGPEALQRLVEKHKRESKKSRGARRFPSGRAETSSAASDDDSDDSASTSSWESDATWDDSRASPPRGARAGPRDAGAPSAFAKDSRKADFLKRGEDDFDFEAADDLNDAELESLMRSMPPEMFQRFLREDADHKSGTDEGEEAAALMALLDQMGKAGDPSDLPPKLERLLGSLAGGGAGAGGEGKHTRGGGGGGRPPSVSRRTKRAGRAAFRRGKNGVGSGGVVSLSKRSSADAGGSSSSLADLDPSGPGADDDRHAEATREFQKSPAHGVHRTASSFGPTASLDIVTDASRRAIEWSPSRAAAAADGRPLPDLSNLDRDVLKRWIDASKEGNVDAMRRLLKRAGPSLLYHRSPGIGHAALHWSASRGDSNLDASRWLLEIDVSFSVRALSETETETETDARAGPFLVRLANHEGATALHAAAGIGSCAQLRLLASFGSDPRARDLDGFSAADVAERRGHVAFAESCRQGERVFQEFFATRNHATHESKESKASKEDARVSKDAEDATPFESGDATAAAAADPAVVLRPPASAPEPRETRSDSEDSDGGDEASRAAKLLRVAAEAKRKGNEAFAANDYAKAVKQFTMAIRMDAKNHVLFSNRSAARAGLGKYEDALSDAERCIRMAPKWGKGYGRKGAALTGLGQGGEAVKAYLAGLAVEPENASLRDGLAEAKAAIRSAQDRYKEMWGKEVPGGDEA